MRITDLAAEDEGVLLCWSLTLAYEEEGYICDLYNQSPVVASELLDVVYETPRWIWLPGLDPDGDVITFAVTELPQHGSLSDLDTATGWVLYTPAPGFVGSDQFGFEVSDGYSTSEPAEIELQVMPPSVDIGVELEGPEVAGLSQGVTQVVRATNFGPNRSLEASLNYELPSGAALVSVDADPEDWTITGDTVHIELGQLDVWTSREVRVQFQMSVPGLITNRVEVMSPEVDWQPSNNTAERVTDVRTDTDLAVGLELGATEGLVGRDLEYEVGVTNLGPHDAEAVVVEVEWLRPFELVSVEPSQGDWDQTNGVVRCELGALGVGAEAGIRLVVRALEDGMLTNVVRVRSGELDLEPENNEVEGVVAVARLVDLGIVQEGGGGPVLLGQGWQIGIGVTNAGPSAASGVMVSDALPEGVELVEAVVSQGEWTNAVGGLTWEVGGLGIGEGARMDLLVRAATVGWKTNDVSVISEEAEGNGEDNESQVAAEVVPAADLGLGLGAGLDSTLVLGAEVRYGLIVTNSGPSEATGVVLSGRLGEGLELVDVEWSGEWSQTNGLVRFEVGALGVGQSVEVGLKVGGSVEGVWTNAFTVEGTEADAVSENNAVEWITEVRKETDLAVGLELGATEGLVGRDLEYEVGVTNLGPHDAEAVVVEVEWLGPFELVSVEPSQGDWDQTNGVVRCELGALGVGAEAGIRLVVRALEDGMLTNVVRVRSGELDLEPENNEVEGVVAVARLVDLGIVQEGGGGPVLLGQGWQIGIGVTNAGPSAASGVMVSDALPEGVELVEAVVSQGEWTNAVGGLTWEVGGLGIGEGARMDLLVRAATVGWKTNDVSVISEEAEGNGEDNESQVAAEVVPAADLGLGLGAGLDSTLVLGAEVRYGLIVTNSGPSEATGVVLSGRLGEGLELVDVEWSGEWSQTNGLVRFEVGALGVGQSVEVGLKVGGSVEGVWTNAFTVEGTEADAVSENNAVEWITEVRKETDLAVGLELGATEGLVGRDLEYEVGVTNLGPHDAEAVVVEVEWLGPFELVSVEPSQGDWDQTNGVVRCELGALGVGAEAGIRLVVRALEDGMLTNVVRVRSGELDLEPENNEVEGVVAVARLVDLGIVQEGGGGPVLLGQGWQIGIGVTNAGPSAASGVMVSDALPEGVELVEAVVSQGEWTNTVGGLTWEVGGLGIGEGARMDLLVRAATVGWKTNDVSVISEEAEGNGEDNESQVAAEVVPAADLGLGLGAGLDSTLVLGAEVRYGLIVTNSGPSEATGVVLSGRLGEGLELVDVEWSGEWSQTNGLVRCEVGALGVGQSVEVGLKVGGSVEGVWTNAFTVEGTEVDTASENNVLEWLSEVRRESDLAVGLELGATEGLVGRDLEYEVGVTNLGPHDAEAVALDIEWLGKVELVSVEPSQGDWVMTASHLGWAAGDLPAFSEARVTVVVRPVRAGEVQCEVSAATSTFDPIAENNSVSNRIEVLPEAELRLRQSANRSPVMVGDELTYSISVQNEGDYTVSDIRLVDQLPAGVQLVSAVISQGIVNNTAGVIEWSLGPLAPGSSASVIATVVPQQPGQLVNIVNLLSAYVDPENPDLSSGPHHRGGYGTAVDHIDRWHAGLSWVAGGCGRLCTWKSPMAWSRRRYGSRTATRMWWWIMKSR